jgi:hypothetical protein
MQLAINSNFYDVIATSSGGNMSREHPRNTGLAYHHHINFEKYHQTKLDTTYTIYKRGQTQ